MAREIYRIEQLKHVYGGRPVLSIDRLAVVGASIVGLVGPNGSGKSTLLKLLGFIERPTQGQILFEDRPAEPFSDRVRFQVTLLTQEPYLMKRSVFNNVAYGLRLRGDLNDLKDRIYEALAWVGLEGNAFAKRPWYALSGGEAQRVALAARLILRPRVLLLDEPTASVDAASVQLIKDASLLARREWGTTLLIASHDWQWLYEVCDEVRHLFNGQLIATGKGTIVFGPWLPRSDGYWERMLPDGQRLVVVRPPAEQAIALLDGTALRLEAAPAGGDGDPFRLHGTISRLALEKGATGLEVTVSVGNLPFSSRLSPQQVESGRLYPGRRVWIVYRPDAVRWH